MNTHNPESRSKNHNEVDSIDRMHDDGHGAAITSTPPKSMSRQSPDNNVREHMMASNGQNAAIGN